MSRIPLLIFPYNGNGLEALDCLGEQFELIGFVDDTREKQGLSPWGHSIFSRKALEDFPAAQVLAVPGSPTSFPMRQQIIAQLGIPPERFATVIHPSAQISQRAKVGRNVLIMANVVLCGNASVGDHCVILPQSVVHHDSSVGDYTLMGSGVIVAGYSHIGRSCYIGSRTSISNFVTIADQTLVGIGSNVLKPITERAIVAGNPAKPIQK